MFEKNKKSLREPLLPRPESIEMKEREESKEVKDFSDFGKGEKEANLFNAVYDLYQYLTLIEKAIQKDKKSSFKVLRFMFDSSNHNQLGYDLGLRAKDVAVELNKFKTNPTIANQERYHEVVDEISRINKMVKAMNLKPYAVSAKNVDVLVSELKKLTSTPANRPS